MKVLLKTCVRGGGSSNWESKRKWKRSKKRRAQAQQKNRKSSGYGSCPGYSASSSPGRERRQLKIMTKECIEIGQTELMEEPCPNADSPSQIPIPGTSFDVPAFNVESPGASPTSVFDIEVKKDQPISKQRRSTNTRMELFEEHVLSCVEDVLNLRSPRPEDLAQSSSPMMTPALWDAADSEDSVVDICAIRGTLRAVLFAPFSELRKQRDAVSNSESAWTEWANLTKAAAAECALESRALHRFALKVLDDSSQSSSSSATVLAAAYRAFPGYRPSIWRATEATVQAFLVREKALVAMYPSMLSQRVDVDSNQARQLGSLISLIRLWSRISKLAFADTSEGRMGGIAASVRLFQLLLRSRVQMQRHEVTELLEQCLPLMIAAAPIAPLAAILPLLRRMMCDGPAHVTVRLLKLLKVSLLGCPANVLQSQPYLLMSVQQQLFKSLASPQFQVVLEALGIIGNTYVMLHAILSHPHGYAMLSEALCANRSHWHQGVRAQSEECYDAILDYA